MAKAVKTLEKDLGFAKLMREFKKLDAEPTVKVGWPAEQAKTGQIHSSGSLTNVAIALIHEFGSPEMGIPERSIIRAGTDQFRKEWDKVAEKLFKQVLDGKLTLEVALERLGLKMLADLKRRMQSGIAPALTSRDGTALVDTGQLLNSMTYKRIMKS